MADNPFKPKNDGKIDQPKITPGMNKRGPGKTKGNGKGKDFQRLGETSDSDDDAKILERIRKRMDRMISRESENRKSALEDLKFLAGDQWPSDILAKRSIARRPALTINKLPTFVHQITNDLRANRPSINISPVGDKVDVESAKILSGLVRFIERDSFADVAYDTAAFNQVANGYGYILLRCEYESPDSFNQRLCIDRVRNPFSVYLDPDHLQPDASDCNYQCISEFMPLAEFKEQYPNCQAIPFDQTGMGERAKNFITADSIRLMLYYEVKQTKKTLVALSNGFVGYKEDLAPEVLEHIKTGDLVIDKEEDRFAKQVKWYKCTALDIIERGDWIGRWCPVVKVIGDEIDIEGSVRYMGVVRNAKDAQRQFNYAATKEAEDMGIVPITPWVMEEGQLEGHEDEWQRSNTEPVAVLTYKGSSINGQPAPPPQRQPRSQPSAGWVQVKQGAAADMQATTGIRFDATINERVHDESGKALKELRRSSDIGSLHFSDNFSRSLRHLGEMIIEIIPKIYDTERTMTILQMDDSEMNIRVDPSQGKALTEGKTPEGKRLPIFNPKIGKYGVTVTSGPSYATKRIEAAESMMQFAQFMPETAHFIADLIAKNQDWPGAQEVAARLIKTLPPEITMPDPKDIPPALAHAMQMMQKKLQEMTMTNQNLQKVLADQTADRQLRSHKIDVDFEAKLLGIAQKAQAVKDQKVGGEIKALADSVIELMQTLNQGDPNGQANAQAH